MEKPINLKEISDVLTEYWSRKENKPLASRIAVKSTVFDELFVIDRKWFKKVNRIVVDRVTDMIMSNIK